MDCLFVSGQLTSTVKVKRKKQNKTKGQEKKSLPKVQFFSLFSVTTKQRLFMTKCPSQTDPLLPNANSSELTLNLNMLICLTTGQRGQTIHKMDVSYIQEMDGRYRITVCDKLKQTKPGRHLEPIDLFPYPNDKKLFVVEDLKEYLHRTEQLLCKLQKGAEQFMALFN
ncbi:unnamed protein product, partial [Porites lobata]